MTPAEQLAGIYNRLPQPAKIVMQRSGFLERGYITTAFEPTSATMRRLQNDGLVKYDFQLAPGQYQYSITTLGEEVLKAKKEMAKITKANNHKEEEALQSNPIYGMF